MEEGFVPVKVSSFRNVLTYLHTKDLEKYAIISIVKNLMLMQVWERNGGRDEKNADGRGDVRVLL